MRNLLFILCIFFPVIASAQVMKFDGNFNDGVRNVGGLLNLNKASLSCSDSGMRIITSPYAVDGYAMQANLTSTDADCYPGTKRDEGEIFKVNGDTSVPDDYYGFDVTFVNWVHDDRNLLFFQCIQNIPVLAGWIRSDGVTSTFSIRQQWDTTQPRNAFPAPVVAPRNVVETDQFNITANVKYRLDFKINWQYNHTGYVDVYVNRVFSMRLSGPNICKFYDLAHPRYPKFRFGCYGFAYHGTPSPTINRKIVFDNVSLGNSSQITWQQYLDYYDEPIIPIPPVINADKFIIPLYISN